MLLIQFLYILCQNYKIDILQADFECKSANVRLITSAIVIFVCDYLISMGGFLLLSYLSAENNADVFYHDATAHNTQVEFDQSRAIETNSIKLQSIR